LYFRGTNTYTGGTRVQTQSVSTPHRIRTDQALGLGVIELLNPANNPDFATLYLDTASLTLPNEIRGKGYIRTDATRLLTVTNALSPFDTGLTNWVKVAGQQDVVRFRIERLKFGTDAVGATYNFQYNATTNDWVGCDYLEFGAASPKLNVEWLGAGDPAEGTYTLFTYTTLSGATPTWTVTTPPSLRGTVRINTDQKRVELELLPSANGMLILIR